MVLSLSCPTTRKNIYSYVNRFVSNKHGIMLKIWSYWTVCVSRYVYVVLFIKWKRVSKHFPFVRFKYILRWPTSVTATTNVHGKIQLTHGKIQLTHGRTKLTHARTKLTHGRTKLTHARTKFTSWQCVCIYRIWMPTNVAMFIYKC